MIIIINVAIFVLQFGLVPLAAAGIVENNTVVEYLFVCTDVIEGYYTDNREWYLSDFWALAKKSEGSLHHKVHFLFKTLHAFVFCSKIEF